MNKLKGRSALVTGATKRIGRAICLALAQAGANVVVHYGQSASEAEELCSRLQDSGVSAWPIQADLEDEKTCQELVPRVLGLAGSLDFLVNNASIFLPSTMRDLVLEDLLKHLRVNAWAPFVLSREFAAHASQGGIVNLLDSRVVGYDWSHVGYILSKQALALLTQMMALEFAPKLTVNAVAPGLILPPPGKDASYLQQFAQTVPLKRHGNPEDIAEAVLYLLSSQFVTGQTIFVDGGRHLMEERHGPDNNY